MKKWNGYETTQIMGIKRKLPAGAYVCKILDAKEESYGWGSVLVISFDIEEGDYKHFFREQYEKQTGSTKKWKGTYRLNCPLDNGDEKDEKLKRNFKTFIHHIENSNSGYKWDWNELSLKGKLFGGVFGEKEYDVEGNTGFYTLMRYATDLEGIKNAQIPKPILLKKEATSSTAGSSVEWGNDEALPF